MKLLCFKIVYHQLRMLNFTSTIIIQIKNLSFWIPKLHYITHKGITYKKQNLYLIPHLKLLVYTAVSNLE